MDHIIPRAVVPELDNVIANLELMPLRMNEGKNAKIGARQKDLAKKLRRAGLLSEDGPKAVLGVNVPAEKGGRNEAAGASGHFSSAGGRGVAGTGQLHRGQRGVGEHHAATSGAS